MRGIWILALGCLAASAAAQEPSPPDARIAAVEAVARAGQAAFEAGRLDEARAHVREALAGLATDWPEPAAERTRRVLALQRALTWTEARRRDAEAFQAAFRAAYAALATLGGEAREEVELERAAYALRRELGRDPGPQLAALAAQRAILESVVPVPPPPGDDFVRRTRQLVGQVIHDTAIVHEAAGNLAAAETTLREALRLRTELPDPPGAAWSAHNLFWVLHQAGRDADAAAAFADAARRVAASPVAEVAARLGTNLEQALVKWVAGGARPRAIGFIGAIRQAGFPAQGLPTCTGGRLVALELALRAAEGPVPLADARRLAGALFVAADAESQPAWRFTGAMALATAAVREGTGPEAREAAAHAVAGAEALRDPRRLALAQVMQGLALAAEGRRADGEGAIRAVFATAGRPGGDVAVREVARRAGAALAAAASDPEWAARYAPDVIPAAPPALAGLAVMGRDLRAVRETLDRLTGEGPILAITRRGGTLILRSPLYPGTVAVDCAPRLRYVNANGIVLAVQGPDVAVIRWTTDASAPPAKGGRYDPDPASDPFAIDGEPIPLLAPQITIPDGETALVDRWLRISR